MFKVKTISSKTVVSKKGQQAYRIKFCKSFDEFGIYKPDTACS